MKKANCQIVKLFNKILGIYNPSNSAENGWAEWGEWSQCSVSCRSGKQMRSRFCGEIKDGAVDMKDSVWTWQNKDVCPEAESQETRPCFMGTCLPQSNDFWKKGSKPFRQEVADWWNSQSHGKSPEDFRKCMKNFWDLQNRIFLF